MSVKGYLALLVGVFVAALAVVSVTQRATAGRGWPAVVVPVLVTLVVVALAALLIHLVLRDIARPFHSAGALDVTASIGVASGAEDGWEGLVRRADTGLYAAKEGGRNRVVAGPPAEAGGPRTGEGECGKIGATGSGPARHRERGSGWPTSR